MILRGYTFTSAFLISHTQKKLMCKKWALSKLSSSSVCKTNISIITEQWKKHPIMTKKAESCKLSFILSHCLTQKSVIMWLELGVCTYIQFLAAKSLWTNFLLARYFIPFATWRPNPIKSFTVGFCKIQLWYNECTSPRSRLFFAVTLSFWYTYLATRMTETGWCL